MRCCPIFRHDNSYETLDSGFIWFLFFIFFLYFTNSCGEIESRFVFNKLHLWLKSSFKRTCKTSIPSPFFASVAGVSKLKIYVSVSIVFLCFILFIFFSTPDKRTLNLECIFQIKQKSLGAFIETIYFFTLFMLLPKYFKWLFPVYFTFLKSFMYRILESISQSFWITKSPSEIIQMCNQHSKLKYIDRYINIYMNVSTVIFGSHLLFFQIAFLGVFILILCFSSDDVLNYNFFYALSKYLHRRTEI